LNIFSDACVRLKYSGGTVSFCLESDQSSYAGTTVHMPFDAFVAMQAAFSNEMDALKEKHQHWLASHAAEVPASETEAPTQQAREPLGVKIASVSTG